ncbi:MAG: hypothetical protein OEY67_00350 [Gammaproteobacteria bacterium]|nr:hypothetical protein [Gammaproteobacteria bacterium]
MLNIGELIDTVQTNCHISDAKYAGNYSMCTFLLKMREYYRWENEFSYSATLEKDDIGNWLVSRERSWQEIESDDFMPLPLQDTYIDPFDTDTINNIILDQGYVYSSGYGIFGKPHFFIGHLLEKRRRDDMTILISSCEYARDLVAPPAMTRDKTIFIRQESVTRFLWERIEEWKWNKKKDTPMARAIACYGNDDNISELLSPLTDGEIGIMVLHEYGEVMVGKQLGPDWEKMLWMLSGTKAEFMVRALRDNLADCLSTLPELIRMNIDAPLHLFFANFSGLRKHLFPEAAECYRQWLLKGSIKPLESLIYVHKDIMLEKAQQILHLFRSGNQETAAGIESLLDPGPAN